MIVGVASFTYVKEATDAKNSVLLPTPAPLRLALAERQICNLCLRRCGIFDAPFSASTIASLSVLISLRQKRVTTTKFPTDPKRGTYLIHFVKTDSHAACHHPIRIVSWYFTVSPCSALQKLINFGLIPSVPHSLTTNFNYNGGYYQDRGLKSSGIILHNLRRAAGGI